MKNKYVWKLFIKIMIFYNVKKNMFKIFLLIMWILLSQNVMNKLSDTFLRNTQYYHILKFANVSKMYIYSTLSRLLGLIYFCKDFSKLHKIMHFFLPTKKHAKVINPQNCRNVFFNRGIAVELNKNVLSNPKYLEIKYMFKDGSSRGR